jgi:parallel beta-helix repeat protein
MAIKFTIIIFAIFTLLLISSPVNQQQTSSAASVTTVPNDFPTIQAAINAAKSGDTIDVLPGTYVEQLTVPKDLTIVGAGSKSTFLRAPVALQQNAAGRPYIIDVNNKAKLSLKGFSIRGPDGTECDRLVAISVLGSAVLSFESSVIRGCIARGVQVGTAFGSHPQYGVATITKIDLVGYRDVGIFAIGKGSAIKVHDSDITAANAPETVGQTGIEFIGGALGVIDHNRVSQNICKNSACGPDYFNQFQAFGIAFEGEKGSIISNNEVLNNDVGIGASFSSGCCKISDNVLKNNRFFGITIQDGKYTSREDKISGGNVGVAAIAISASTVATLINDEITKTAIPTQELSCCGFTASIVSVPSDSFKVSKLQFNIKSSQVQKLLSKYQRK